MISSLALLGAPYCQRRISMIADSGVTVLSGPRWSGTRLLAAGWAAQQRAAGLRVREAVDLDPAGSDAVILDLSASPEPHPQDRLKVRGLFRACADGDLRAVLVLTRSAGLGLALFDGVDGGVPPTVIGPGALRLDDLELAEFLSVAPSARPVTTMRQLSDGWLRLVDRAGALVMKQNAPSVSEMRQTMDRLVLEDLDVKVGNVEGTELSLLCSQEYWDAEVVQLADPSYDLAAARNLLVRAEASGIGWVDPCNGHVLRIVRPLAAAVRRAESESSSGPRQAMQRRLALGLIERARLSDAVRLVEAQPEPELAWTLLKAAFDAGRWDLCIRVAAAVADRPREWFSGPVDFFVLVTLVNMGRTGRYVEWSAALIPAAAELEVSGERSLIHLQAAINCFRVVGDMQRSLFYARQAVQVSRATGTGRSPGAEALTLGSAYLTLVMAGDIETASWVAERASAAAAHVDHDQIEEGLGAFKQFSQALIGNLRGIDPAAPRLDPSRHTSLIVGAHDAATAVALYESGQLPQARARIVEARDALAETDLWWTALQVEAIMAAHAGDTARARVIVEEAQRLLRAGRVVLVPEFLRSLDVCTMLLLGRAVDALRAVGGGRDPDDPDLRVMLAAVCAAMGDYRRAYRLTVRPTAASVVRRATLSGLIAAVSAERLGYLEQARQRADHAVRLIEHMRLLSAVRYLTPEGQQVLLSLLDDEWAARVRDWCDLHGSIHGAEAAPQLTRRERQVLTALCGDLSASQIAEELSVSVNTVKTLRRRLYGKLGVSTRDAAAEVAARLRLV